MTPTRLRAGAAAWLLTLQFFVVEAVAESRFAGPYSRTDTVISALGGADSAARQLMNASFVVQGALILGGALLLRPVLLRGAASVAPVLLGAAAVGVLLVGVFPITGNSTLHGMGAVLYFVGGGLGLIALAYAVRPRSEALGTVLALLGLVGMVGTVLFLTGVTSFLGVGGTERVAAYVLPIGLAVAGVTLARLAGRPTGATGPTPRQERQLARAERAEEDRRRDEALEAAASRPDPGADEHGDDDPWAAPRRRGD